MDLGGHQLLPAQNTSDVTEWVRRSCLDLEEQLALVASGHEEPECGWVALQPLAHVLCVLDLPSLRKLRKILLGSLELVSHVINADEALGMGRTRRAISRV